MTNRNEQQMINHKRTKILHMEHDSKHTGTFCQLLLSLSQTIDNSIKQLFTENTNGLICNLK